MSHSVRATWMVRKRTRPACIEDQQGEHKFQSRLYVELALSRPLVAFQGTTKFLLQRRIHHWGFGLHTKPLCLASFQESRRGPPIRCQECFQHGVERAACGDWALQWHDKGVFSVNEGKQDGLEGQEVARTFQLFVNSYMYLTQFFVGPERSLLLSLFTSSLRRSHFGRFSSFSAHSDGQDKLGRWRWNTQKHCISKFLWFKILTWSLYFSKSEK